MFRNQLKIILRNFRKYPVYSLLNIGGLSIAIAASFILLLFVKRESSTDFHFDQAGNIYRISTDFYNMGGFAKSQPMIKDHLVHECKDVAFVTSFDRSYQDENIYISDNVFPGYYPYYIDNDFFKVFSYEASEGYLPASGLRPGEAILSESAEKSFFGHQSAIGKSIAVGRNDNIYHVIAILKSNISKSHLQPEIILPLKKNVEDNPRWSSAVLYNYVRMKPGATQKDLEAYINLLLEKTVYPSSHTANSYTQWKNSNASVKFFIQPLTDIYFTSQYRFEVSPGGNYTQVKILGVIGIMLIMLAIINYVNLTTARITIRSKEVGIKKTLGAAKKTLIKQLMLESVVFSLLAMISSIALIKIILVCYGTFTGNTLLGAVSLVPVHFVFLLLFCLVTGLLAGIYPAFYFSSFTPASTLKGNYSSNGKGNNSIRSALVVVQFIVASALIFSTLVIWSQLRYMNSKDKGFDDKGVVIIENAGELKDQANAFRQSVAQLSQVSGTSFCNRTPAGKSLWMYTFKTNEMKDEMTIQTFPADDQYIHTLGLQLKEGRNFSQELASDSNAIILNEAAVAALGLKSPVGALLNSGRAKVIGVIRDFNFVSFHEKIEPVALSYSRSGYTLAVKINKGQAAGFAEKVNTIWKIFNRKEAPRISFLDEDFARLAAKEKLLGNAITFFSLLAIIIASLGLIGLTAFAVEKRTKEIGIRKILGAATAGILNLLSKEFLRLTLLSTLIAIPATWYFMDRWLNDFAYRVHINASIIILTLLITIMIALLSVYFVAIRAALANPVKSLRTE
jgi:putative ABC transport system permease protein